MQGHNFKVEVVNVFRDTSQGLFANLIPLNHPLALEYFKLWDKLAQSQNPHVKFSAIEAGGADPQVTAVIRNYDFMETYRQIRKVAPNSPIRPLWRGANGFLLSPSNPADLEHLLQNLAEDIASAGLSKEQQAELLRIKVFDSQGNMKEVKSTIDIIAKLRAKGHPITAEIAIPYSSGEAYPDELYIQKAVDAAKLLHDSGLPLNLCRISLKDMVGELDASTASRLIPAMIDVLKSQALQIPLGLHLHDTGLALDTYVAAIKACKEKNYPITIDTVEAAAINQEYTGKDAWKNSGFVSTIALNNELKKQEIDLGLTEGQLSILNQMDELAKQVMIMHDVARAEPSLTGEELRQFHIPGGGFASFKNAVNALDGKGLATLLGISEQDSFKLAGYGLATVGKLMGEPFAVTPGFQNKQIAALNLILNMIKADILKPGMSFNELQHAVTKELDAQQVNDLFLKNLDPVVKKFLSGEMPAETMAKLKIQTTATVHPEIRQKIPLNTGLLTDGVESKLPAAKAVAETLLKQGKIKPTPIQAENALRELRAEQPITKKLEEKTLQTATTWALELGDPNKLVSAIEKHWLRAPNPADYGVGGKYRNNDDSNNNHSSIEAKAEYEWAVAKSRKGRNPTPDKMELLMELVKHGKIPLEVANNFTQTALAAEQADIKVAVLTYLNANPQDISATISQNKDALTQIVTCLYVLQQETIKNKESEGEYFLFPEERRLDIAFDVLANELNRIAIETGQPHEGIKNAIVQKREEIESSVISVPMPGKITEVCIDTSKGSVPVKKGDIITKIEAMKMIINIYAPKDGTIISVNAKAGQIIEKNQLLASYDKQVAVSAEQNGHNAAPVAPIDLSASQNRLAEFYAEAVVLNKNTSADITKIQAITATYQPQPQKDDLMSKLSKRGYNAQPLSLSEEAKPNHQNEIHIVGNRAGCAAKLYGDLMQAGCDARVLYTAGDITTPVIANAAAGEAILVASYNDHDTILASLKKIAEENPGKKIFFHPGWGFLSEDDAFVAKVEELGKTHNVLFVGPPSEPMKTAGGKLTLRNLVKKVASDFNPQYFGNHHFTAEDLNAYIKGTLPANKREAIAKAYRQHFEDIIGMGGDVMTKAIYGGGGKGIKRFTYDKDTSKEANYYRYMKDVQENIAYSEKHFGNGSVLTEQCVTGATRHLEVQFATNAQGAILFGLRDCTLQNKGQKILETNVIKGDYVPETIEKTIKAAGSLAEELARQGYKGVGTLEMLVQPNGNVKFLEVNTRVQVEHRVTEADISLKTGQSISLPLVNLAFSDPANQDKIPVKLLQQFGLNHDDLQTCIQPGIERVEHFRINSKEIDLQKGDANPSYFDDRMWPGTAAVTAAAQATNADIFLGGLGKGNYDSQVGAICGTSKQTAAAAKYVSEFVATSSALNRNDGTISIDFSLELREVMYNENGNFREGISTKTVDELLESIKNGQIKLETDPIYLGVKPKLKAGEMEKALGQLLELQQPKQDVALPIVPKLQQQNFVQLVVEQQLEQAKSPRIEVY
jgi:pyruvate carboxylase